VSGGGVSDRDMPNFPWPRRGASSAEDGALAALLAGAELPASAPGELRPVADLLAALQAPPAAGELATEASVLAEFRHRIGVPAPQFPPRRRRRPVLTSVLSAKAAAVAIAALTLGGAAAAAYAGALPASVQQFAHDTVGAPAAHHRPSATPRRAHGAPAKGPNAAGHAAYGLCTAYRHALAHGSAAQKAVAFRNLVKAAGGASKVAQYCAGIPHPGPSPSRHHHAHPTPTPNPSGHGHHHAHPTPHPSGHPSHRPSPHPTGSPTPVP
jgi:hypothetical protein